jgi:hypothetical protein
LAISVQPPRTACAKAPWDDLVRRRGAGFLAGARRVAEPDLLEAGFFRAGPLLPPLRAVVRLVVADPLAMLLR